MNIRTFSLIIACALLFVSCKTAQKTAQPQQLPEVNSKTEVTVRTESVKPIDPSERTMYRFYVIIGSFRSIDNARQYTAGLVSEGFTPVILESESGLFRISAGGYDDENAARAKIAGIRSVYQNHSDVWLLIRK